MKFFYIGEEYLDTLSDLKSKDEVIADIVTLAQSPARILFHLYNLVVLNYQVLLRLFQKDQNSKIEFFQH